MATTLVLVTGVSASTAADYFIVNGDDSWYSPASKAENTIPAPRCSSERKEFVMRHLFLALMVTLMYIPAQAQSKVPHPEESAIRATALDYIEGWYDGDAVRMERALHPQLAKRAMVTDPQSGQTFWNHQDAPTLVQGTRMRAAKPTPKDQQQKDVTVLDVFENAAVVKIVAADWIDYLQLLKSNGRWTIVNVLWERKPRPTR
jgi:hypothetical protein